MPLMADKYKIRDNEFIFSQTVDNSAKMLNTLSTSVFLLFLLWNSGNEETE